MTSQSDQIDALLRPLRKYSISIAFERDLDKAYASIKRLVLEGRINELELAHENWFKRDKRWMEYTPERIKNLKEEMEGLKP